MAIMHVQNYSITVSLVNSRHDHAVLQTLCISSNSTGWKLWPCGELCRVLLRWSRLFSLCSYTGSSDQLHVECVLAQGRNLRLAWSIATSSHHSHLLSHGCQAMHDVMVEYPPDCVWLTNGIPEVSRTSGCWLNVAGCNIWKVSLDNPFPGRTALWHQCFGHNSCAHRRNMLALFLVQSITHLSASACSCYVAA